MSEQSKAWVWSQYQGQIIHAENIASDQSLAWEKKARSLDREPKSKTLNSDQARGIADNIKNIVKKNEEKKRSQRKSWPKSFGVGAIVAMGSAMALVVRSEEHTSELQSH